MTVEKMSIHKALTELKVIDSRIIRAINDCTPVIANKSTNTMVNGKPLTLFAEEMKSGVQSAKDLIRRRNAIKAAVIVSNASTYIEVNGEKYTVAEAIDLKNNGIDLMQRLLTRMGESLKVCNNHVERMNREAENDADKFIESNFGKNVTSPEMVAAVTKARADEYERRKYDLFDPMNISKEMETLMNFIDSFNVEIDSALSVSNALTEITVQY